MLASSIFISLAGLIPLSTASYVLQEDYRVDNFFSKFDFFTAPDPTNGYVTYVGEAAAQAAGLVNTNNNGVYMGVDYTNKASGSGRQSVRLTSKKIYTHGLFILDLLHMPGSICGAWPAFWTYGPNWPESGEIDIIEGVNSQSSNSMALHTTQGCSIANNGLFSGTINTPNCDVKAPGQANNAGCQVLMSNSASYGTGFNQGQGGVYATEWTSTHISIWFFPRGAIPSDISVGNPNPGNWGQPAARFAGGCEIDNFFSNHRIVFDTTFCGDWAANVWSSDPVCSSKAPTCQEFVQNNPAAFREAFWTVKSLKVYQSPLDDSVPLQPHGSQGPVAFPATDDSNGVPDGLPHPTPVDSQLPSTGFSRGANGSHTKTWGEGGSGAGKANFADVETGLPPASGAAGPVEDNGQGGSPSPETAPIAEAGAGGDDTTNDNVEYVTVPALEYEYFAPSGDGSNVNGNGNDKRDTVVAKKDAPFSPAELGVPLEAETSKRDTMPDMQKRAADKSTHLHLHRHGRRHSFFGGVEGRGTVQETK